MITVTKERLMEMIELIQNNGDNNNSQNENLRVNKELIMQDAINDDNVIIWTLIEGMLYSSSSEFGSSNFEDRVQVSMFLREILNLYKSSEDEFRDNIFKEAKFGFSLGVGDNTIKAGMIQFILTILDQAGIIEFGDSGQGDSVWNGWLTNDGEILLELLNAYDFQK